MTRIFHRAAALAALAALAACSKPVANTASSTASNTAKPTAPAATRAPAPTATGQDAADAKSFLEGLYARYATPPTANSAFAPMDKDAKAVFDASMVALIAKDAKLTGSGDVGFIDADWICSCQDYEKITATVTVQSATATTAKATADFKVFGDLTHNAFDLVKENGAWRVHDVQQIGTKDAQPSLRVGLEDDIARMEKEKAAGKKAHDPNVAP